MGGVKPVLTPHAKRRRKEMGVTEDEIATALEEPEIVYPCFGGRTCFCRGRLAVIVAEDRGVVTVLWNGKDER
jgi:hypothetical protein